jgi:spore maturation protein CgeB
MKIVVFGLTVTSSWGNGHATIWRGLCHALARRGHSVHFFERDVPYYSTTRDLFDLPSPCRLTLYAGFDEIREQAERLAQTADLAMVTSYCPDAVDASRLLLDSPARIRAFYDLDTPVTLNQLDQSGAVDYLPPGGLDDFDLVLSYTGGRALDKLCSRLGARVAIPLYGSVDPETHFPVPPSDDFRCDLSYLGTFARDRQETLERLFVEPARLLPEHRFLMAGAQYPQEFPWTPNIFFARHLPPALHPAFFCSSRATLNVTRGAMARYGYCPSGRLFEAAACGVPILSDVWDGLDRFFTPGSEFLPVQTAADVVEALQRSEEELARMSRAARERALAEHTADRRVEEIEDLVNAWPHIEEGADVRLRNPSTLQSAS